MQNYFEKTANVIVRNQYNKSTFDVLTVLVHNLQVQKVLGSAVSFDIASELAKANPMSYDDTAELIAGSN